MIFRRLTKDDENTTTELLANLFQRKYFRDLSLRFLLSTNDDSIDCPVSQDEFDGITESSVSTQIRTKNHGQPDLIIYSDDLFVVFENKVKDNTILQDHELYDYIELSELYKKSKSFLVFLVPVNYQYKAQIESINKSKAVNICLHSWEKFLAYLNSQEFESPLICESLNYLKSFFSDDRDWSLSSKEAFFMFKPEYFFAFLDFRNKFKDRLSSILGIVLEEINKRGFGNFVHAWSNESEGGFGETIRLGKDGYIFFGLSNPKDFQDAKNAYSVCFWTQFFNCNYLLEYPFVKEDKWGWRCIPFFDESFSEMEFLDSKNDCVLASRIIEIISDVCTAQIEQQG